jgi:hypothetical protein
MTREDRAPPAAASADDERLQLLSERVRRALLCPELSVTPEKGGYDPYDTPARAARDAWSGRSKRA